MQLKAKSDAIARPRASPSTVPAGTIPLLPPPPTSGSRIAQTSLPANTSKNLTSSSQFRSSSPPSLLGGYQEHSVPKSRPQGQPSLSSNPFVVSSTSSPAHSNFQEVRQSGVSSVASGPAVDNLL